MPAEHRTAVESWSDVAIDADQTLIYSPRWARLYLLPPAQALAPEFLRVIGLRAPARNSALADPVDRIHRDRTHFTGTPAAAVPRRLVAAYHVFGASRHVLPLRIAALGVRRLAHLARRRREASGVAALDIDSIARTVHAVEARFRSPDCYPRALLTALLCLAAGRDCTLLVGVLAPTRKMHAWCCIDGVLPYERMPEHYMYRPLWMLSMRA